MLKYLDNAEILDGNLFQLQAADEYLNAQLSEAMAKLPENFKMPLEVEPPSESSLEGIIITCINLSIWISRCSCLHNQSDQHAQKILIAFELEMF